MSVQPGHRGNNDLRVGRKMATFQLFFQSGRAKDLSAPLYIDRLMKIRKLSWNRMVSYVMNWRLNMVEMVVKPVSLAARSKA